MSTDQPPPGQPPEDDPFRKRPEEPQPPPSTPPPASGSPYGGAGDGGFPPPGSGSPYGGAGGGGGYPPPPPPYGSDPYGGGYGAPDPLAGMPPLADFGKRLLARIIDALIIGIPLGLIQWGASPNRWTVETDQGEDATEVFTKAYSGGGLLWTLIGIVAYVGYDWYFGKKTGQTLGKKLLGLRVAMLNDGSVPTSNAALSRAAVLWLPALLCCPCIWELVLIVTILSDKPYKQGLHDKTGKTVVVTVT
ncbi:RDD family protein [Streptomyces bambusae]|uniref:RDD family protein n=1 Tax=Streptomyces bambusae TaxID=1550616 RepID=UPI001CFDD0A2|nr:RDD family protein [Streptomyces bambusae]MCB5167264.1 RDD family protein [Streptomyces bambusae]